MLEELHEVVTLVASLGSCLKDVIGFVIDDGAEMAQLNQLAWSMIVFVGTLRAVEKRIEVDNVGIDIHDCAFVVTRLPLVIVQDMTNRLSKLDNSMLVGCVTRKIDDLRRAGE